MDLAAAEFVAYEQDVPVTASERDEQRKRLGAMVRAARRARADERGRPWSREKLAVEVGCSASTITRIEGGVGEEPKWLPKILRVLRLSENDFSPLGVSGDGKATGTKVASTQEEMANITGPQLPASAIVGGEDVRNEMVNLAIDRGDSVEVIRALRQAKPPSNASITWWAATYADLREQHRAAEATRAPRETKK